MGHPWLMLALGVGGVVPFAAAALGGPSGLLSPAFASLALISYGAVILSFLGAVHWGLALAAPDGLAPATRSRLILGVLPALIGWVALLLPRWMGLLLLIAGFLSVWAAEEIAGRQGLMPGRYLWLRRGLTIAVVVCLSAALLQPAPLEG